MGPAGIRSGPTPAAPNRSGHLGLAAPHLDSARGVGDDQTHRLAPKRTLSAALEGDGGRRPRDRSRIGTRQNAHFRGRVAIRSTLRRRIPESKEEDIERLQKVTRLVNRLIAEIELITHENTWRIHVSNLQRIVESFGLASDEPASLETLREALDDHAAVLDGIDQGEEDLAFEDFASELDRIVNDMSGIEAPIAPAGVIVTTADLAEGARGRHVFLVNLAEGTFPTSDSLSDASGSQASAAYSREISRFLRVVGSADRTLTLVYPTRDEKGQAMLVSGFLDDLMCTDRPQGARPRSRIAPADRPHVSASSRSRRLAERCPRARHRELACSNESTTELRALATDPRHRPALLGAAAALRLEYDRSSRTRGFTPYEGKLNQPDAVNSVTDHFDSEYTFSPSQLETYLTCPFRFFMQYVLRLEPIDDSDELDEDRTLRGQIVHEALENLERERMQEDSNAIELAPIRVSSGFSVTLGDDPEIDPGRREIERRWLMQTLQRYAIQAEEYAIDKGSGARPRYFELTFGRIEQGATYPHLVIGFGPEAVKLRGSIDRVDLIETSGKIHFRVIDYKTGKAPTGKDLDDLLMLQLPLYAKAFESLEIAGESARLLDVGYWELSEKGFKPIVREWPELLERVEAKVLETAAKIRSGGFEVDPREKDCTRSCDFGTVCRIRQVRSSRKSSREDES